LPLLLLNTEAHPRALVSSTHTNATVQASDLGPCHTLWALTCCHPRT